MILVLMGSWRDYELELAIDPSILGLSFSSALIGVLADCVWVVCVVLISTLSVRPPPSIS